MIKTDSRKIKPGDTFIALKGMNKDGHNYIENAIQNGASKVIVEHGTYNVETIIVKNTNDYLKEYLEKKYKKIISEMKIIGVTGTNGKTTISYLIYKMLNKLGKKCAMIGTLGYYRETKIEELSNTCPELLKTYELINNAYENGYKYIVLEASSQGLQEERLYGIKFEIAIFTNLTHDHLDYHKTMEQYLKAKQKLFKQLKKAGTGIINIDDEYGKYFESNNTITYGFNKSDYQIIKYKPYMFKFKHDKIYKVKNKLLGKYNSYNILSSIIALEKLGLNTKKIIKTIKNIEPPKGRIEMYKYKKNQIIVDYAHTPDAIEKVLETIKIKNNIYAVFGCTGNRDKEKRPIMTKILLEKCNEVIITSDDLYEENFNNIVEDMIKNQIKDNYEIIPDRKKAIEKGISYLKKNDILLILGKGHERYIKVKNKLIEHNDGETVIKILENINKKQ